MTIKNCTSVNWPDCPCYRLSTERGYARCARELDCHLTPAAFPRLRAELAGEWTCRTCALSGHCEFEKLARFDYFACVVWTPKGE
jgi:hypothetical protein